MRQNSCFTLYCQEMARIRQTRQRIRVKTESGAGLSKSDAIKQNWIQMAIETGPTLRISVITHRQLAFDWAAPVDGRCRHPLVEPSVKVAAHYVYSYVSLFSALLLLCWNKLNNQWVSFGLTRGSTLPLHRFETHFTDRLHLARRSTRGSVVSYDMLTFVSKCTWLIDQ